MRWMCTLRYMYGIKWKLYLQYWSVGLLYSLEGIPRIWYIHSILTLRNFFFKTNLIIMKTGKRVRTSSYSYKPMRDSTLDALHLCPFSRFCKYLSVAHTISIFTIFICITGYWYELVYVHTYKLSLSWFTITNYTSVLHHTVRAIVYTLKRMWCLFSLEKNRCNFKWGVGSYFKFSNFPIV